MARGCAVTIGDVAASAGISVQLAQEALRALAADSQAVLRVSDAGEVLYSFDPDFIDRVRAKSRRIRLEGLVSKAQTGAAYLARITFGSMLLVSVATVALAFMAIASSSSQSDRDSRDRRHSGGGSYHGGPAYYRRPGWGPHMYIDLTDLLWYWSPRYPQYRQQRVASGQAQGMSFLEAVFSFVFGDGDPNADLDSRRWEQVGKYIQARGGVVAAEELAPLLDGRGTESRDDAVAVDESYVLPALIRFNGSPVVDAEGGILYQFPNLQSTAASQVRRKDATPFPEALKEQTVPLTRANSGQCILAVGLGLINCLGVAWLGGALRSPAHLHALALHGLAWLPGALPFFQAYAASFFAIPALRALRLGRRNAAIRARNKARARAAAALRTPSRELEAKLKLARSEAAHRRFDQRRVVYTSSEAGEAPSGEEATAAALHDWEARLAARERARNGSGGLGRATPGSNEKTSRGRDQDDQRTSRRREVDHPARRLPSWLDDGN